jgi:regulator of protease activity HflC (stomatin/prohibitin superfamily)
MGALIARVPERHAGIVERTGRYARTSPPGRVMLLPVLDRLRAVVDLREQALAVSLERVPTADGAAVRIAATVRFTIVDPVPATYEVRDVRRALEELSATILRDIAGQLRLDDVLTARSATAEALRGVIAPEVERWGIRIDGTEVERVEVMTYHDATELASEDDATELASEE